jgi:hypothetical protein
MRSSYTPLMQTKYFSPAFNSAIFDGPVRIYFAQFHESFALKVYFLVQQKMMGSSPHQDVATEFKNKLVASKTNVLIMIYASSESFGYSFAKKHNEVWSYDQLQGDLVVGLQRPLEDHELPAFIEDLKLKIVEHLNHFPSLNRSEMAPEALI